MRLYLSSYRIGSAGRKLVELAGEAARVALIMNAADHKNKEDREEKTRQEFEDLAGLGLLVEEIDLRDYFDKETELEEKLRAFQMVYVRGGNTFILKRAFERSGFGQIILRMLREDKIVYAGYSAGVVILAPSMHGLEIVDDPAVVPEGYSQEFDWAGLGILPGPIAVHYKSLHDESELVDKEVEYYKEHGIQYRTLRDGEVIVVEGDKETFFEVVL